MPAVKAKAAECGAGLAPRHDAQNKLHRQLDVQYGVSAARKQAVSTSYFRFLPAYFFRSSHRQASSVAALTATWLQVSHTPAWLALGRVMR